MLKLARRAKGHFMTLIEIRVHLIRCKPGHISEKHGRGMRDMAFSVGLKLVDIFGLLLARQRALF